MKDEFDEYIEYSDDEEEEKGLALVKDHEYLMKDEDTGAVINTDEGEYEAYLKMRELKLAEQKEKSALKHEVDFLKTAVLELQQKLRELQNGS
tara:strand:- start:22 stop:300 length:279 start_codon:yes stop_codon:yes gene_type:complete